jgi:hypothetical protein
MAGVPVIAPVEAFGWLLLSMGVAQCAPHRHWTTLGYLATFGVILVYREIPWMQWVAGRLGTGGG